MKIKQYGTLKGLKLNVGIYESYDEADKAAGVTDAMLTQGNDNLAYRGPLAEGRDIICDMLKSETGIERLTKPTGKKTESGEDVMTFDESEGEYASRVCAEKGWEDLSAFQDKLDALVAAENDGQGLAVDIKARERKAPTPKKLSADYLAAGEKFLANPAKLDQLIEKSNSVYKLNASFTPTGDTAKDKEAVGWLFKRYTDAKRKAEVADLAV